MKFKINLKSFYILSFILMALVTILSVSKAYEVQKNYVFNTLKGEKRVIKCEIPLPDELTQNLYFVAENLQIAKQLLFNSKNGLYFDNSLYIKTVDFRGQAHVVEFNKITCDSVGTQVGFTSL